MTFSLLFIDASLVVEISTSRRLYLKHGKKMKNEAKITRLLFDNFCAYQAYKMRYSASNREGAYANEIGVKRRR
jgi:hypothetical protein